MNYTIMRSDDELQHWGIKGQKWGVRRYQNNDGSLTSAGKTRYRSTGIRSALARRSNEKIDKSFKDWNENAKKRDDAIDLGKKANAAKIAYEKDKGNKQLKDEYKQADKSYKKALKSNTTYRKGVVRQEVGRDISRKYLSEANKVKKQMNKNPNDKSLQKQYDTLMSKHDIERAKARRATEVASKRSNKKAAIKRTMTMTAKSIVASAAVAGGLYAVNKYMSDHQVTLDGRPVRFGSTTVKGAGKIIKAGKEFMKYMY